MLPEHKQGSTFLVLGWSQGGWSGQLVGSWYKHKAQASMHVSAPGQHGQHEWPDATMQRANIYITVMSNVRSKDCHCKMTVNQQLNVRPILGPTCKLHLGLHRCMGSMWEVCSATLAALASLQCWAALRCCGDTVAPLWRQG